MQTILDGKPVAAIAEPQSAPIAEPPEPADFELVLGRLQLASVFFLAIVVIAVFSAISYLAGKSIAPPPKIIERVRVEQVPAPQAAPRPVPAPVAPVAQVAPAAATGKPEAAIFADPQNGSLYIQMGAVEKGIALILVEGLRKQGFQAFAAPGPSEKIFRVLIGPLADSNAYQQAKKAVDDLGLTAFARRYQQ
ncbi:MAG TPA: SPOR domain-containing protein [Bryobacteraceae bacterium]|nr:SPOR domain-containing protein [Bryobacteraceae bacterium]